MSGFLAISDTDYGCSTCDSNGNAWLLVTDSNGNRTFSHCFGGSGSDEFRTAKFDKRGSIWAVANINSTNGDFPNNTSKTLGIVKFDSAYAPTWYNFFGSTGDNEFADFITTSDGGSLLLASTNDTGGDVHYHYGTDPLSFDAYLIKLDSVGNIKWLKVLGGSGHEYPMKVKEQEAGKYSLLIYTNSIDYMLSGLNSDDSKYCPWLLEIDSGGHVLNSGIAKGLGNLEPLDFMRRQNREIVFGGGATPLVDTDFCYPGLGETDFSLVAIDSSYYRQWCKMLGGSSNDDFCYMSVINDSLVILFGSSMSIDGALSSCSNFGDLIAHGWLGLINLNTEQVVWQTSFCCSKDVTPDGLIYDNISQTLYVLMTGGVDGDFLNAAISGTISNTYLFKYRVVTTTGIRELSTIVGSISLYPNPANNQCALKIDEPYQMRSAAIFDDVGREVKPLFDNQLLSSFSINCAPLAPGLYFVTVTNSEGRVGVVKLVRE